LTATDSRQRGRSRSRDSRDSDDRAERPYSPAQHSFVRNLNAERTVPVAGRSAEEAWVLERNFDLLGNHAVFDAEHDKSVTSAEAGVVIDYLLLLPGAPAPMTTGIYRRAGVLFLVRLNGRKTRTHAMQLDGPDLTKTYRGDVTDLTDAEKLPGAEAGPIMARLLFGD
jgi:hypothetical protein